MRTRRMTHNRFADDPIPWRVEIEITRVMSRWLEATGHHGAWPHHCRQRRPCPREGAEVIQRCLLCGRADLVADIPVSTRMDPKRASPWLSGCTVNGCTRVRSPTRSSPWCDANHIRVNSPIMAVHVPAMTILVATRAYLRTSLRR